MVVHQPLGNGHDSAVEGLYLFILLQLARKAVGVACEFAKASKVFKTTAVFR
jgi:hypothetical protein